MIIRPVAASSAGVAGGVLFSRRRVLEGLRQLSDVLGQTFDAELFSRAQEIVQSGFFKFRLKEERRIITFENLEDIEQFTLIAVSGY